MVEYKKTEIRLVVKGPETTRSEMLGVETL